jgi:hypothetical protein
MMRNMKFLVVMSAAVSIVVACSGGSDTTEPDVNPMLGSFNLSKIGTASLPISTAATLKANLQIGTLDINANSTWLLTEVYRDNPADPALRTETSGGTWSSPTARADSVYLSGAGGVQPGLLTGGTLVVRWNSVNHTFFKK